MYELTRQIPAETLVKKGVEKLRNPVTSFDDSSLQHRGFLIHAFMLQLAKLSNFDSHKA